MTDRNPKPHIRKRDSFWEVLLPNRGGIYPTFLLACEAAKRWATL